MNQRILKLLGPFLLTILLTGPVLSQSKTGCDPEDCGPGNTKVAEARVITELRLELQKVIENMNSSSFSYDREVTTFEIGTGASDDESVLFIAQAAAFVRDEMLAKTPSGILLEELKSVRRVPASTKQELIINLKKEVQLLTLQSHKL